jgi:hypothetical protein
VRRKNLQAPVDELKSLPNAECFPILPSTGY